MIFVIAKYAIEPLNVQRSLARELQGGGARNRRGTRTFQRFSLVLLNGHMLVRNTQYVRMYTV